MPKKMILWTLLAVFAAGTLQLYAQTSTTKPTQAQVQQRMTEMKVRAKLLLSSMAGRNFKNAIRHFDDTMKKDLPPEVLAEKWRDHTAQFGALVEQKALRIEKLKQYMLLTLTCEFAQADFDVQMLFDNNNLIAGLFFTPVYREPKYVIANRHRDEEISMGQPAWALPGTLSLPKGKGPFPAVILVHGLGPQDQDETVGPNKPFKDLALGLASRGIAVLRYEKRSKRYQDKMTVVSAITKTGITPKETILEDVNEAILFLRHRKEIDPTRIFILGHSLGGSLIPRIARNNPTMAGFIIMGGPTRPLEEVILTQKKYLAQIDGTITDEEKKSLEELEKKINKVKDPNLTTSVPAKELPLDLAAPFWLYLRDYKPTEVVKEVKQPLFILQGGSDFQSTMEDLEGWKKALAGRDNVTFKVYPALSHLFMKAKDKTIEDYYTIPSNVDREVINDLVQWIQKQIKQKVERKPTTQP